MSDREQRGLALAALYRIDRDGDKWLVPSQTGDGTKYTVDPAAGQCSCPDHRDRGVKCKHMFAVEFVQTRERNEDDGTETVTRTFKVTERVTYRQNWPAYNAAQATEKHRFQAILCDLCRGVPAAPRKPGPGRPPIPRPDLVFAITFKVYSTVSSRRFSCDLEDAAGRGFVAKALHYNSVCAGLEDPELTPILKALIVEASKPLAAVETDFAADSSGFATSRFVRWFDIKYGKTMEEREWVKVHVMTGVKTNVITAVEILDKNAGDAPQLPALLKTTAATFAVKEVSADAGYLSNANLEAIDGIGATPYIAFKENTTGGVGGLLAKCYHYYCFNKDEFLKHYHKRSNAESTFSMMKAKFGDSIRSKTDAAMVNEALCKILCHNICCLIQSMHELGVEPLFWGQDEPAAVACEPVETEADEDIEALAWV
jgi:transposase